MDRADHRLQLLASRRRRLRWRIVSAHMVVVVVGVLVLLLAGWLLSIFLLPAVVEAQLARLTAADSELAASAATAALIDAFQRALLTAVTVAALGAIATGLLTGLLLAREILRPLQEIARSSQRIAAGHYRERVALPASDELATVATHFNQMAAALEAVEEQRVTLIGNVAHELRTPLTGLSGYLEGLMDGLFPADSETFGEMYHEVRRLRLLVDDLQSLSRMESGRIEVELQSVALIPVVARVATQLRAQAQSKDLRLVTQYPAQEIVVYADPDRTAQVLVNLLGNAIRYTPEGGAVTVRVSAGEETAQVVVEDTGVGIPADALPYIFERFYRVDRSRSRQSGGSGIGLTIARHLAWAMEGDVRAASPGEGQGSTFTFTLPLAPTPEDHNP